MLFFRTLGPFLEEVVRMYAEVLLLARYLGDGDNSTLFEWV